MHSEVAVVRGVPPSLARCELTYRAARADRPRPRGGAARGLRRAPPRARPRGRRASRRPGPARLLLRRGRGRRPRRGGAHDDARRRLPARRDPRGRGGPRALPAARAHVRLPATLEGGDVLRVGRTLFVGRSARTNDDGIARLTAVAEPLGYRGRAGPGDRLPAPQERGHRARRRPRAGQPRLGRHGHVPRPRRARGRPGRAGRGQRPARAGPGRSPTPASRARSTASRPSATPCGRSTCRSS